MASYLEKLRSSNVFGGGGGNPFDPPRMNPFNLVDEFMGRNPQLRNIGQQMMQGGGNEALPMQQPPQKPMNVVFNDQELTPYQKAQIGFKQQELGSKERIAGEGQGIKRDELAVKQQLADISDFKAKNPNHIIKQSPDGHLRATDPQTNETIDLGVTGLNQEEIAAINQQNRLGVVSATGEQARLTEGVRQTGREALAKVTGEQARETKGTPSGTPFQPSQQKIDLQVKYNRLINSKPEFRKFVKLDADGMPVVTPVNGGGYFTSAPTQAQFDEINNAIYGAAKKEETPPKQETTKVETKAPVAPKGWKYVPKAGGGWTAVEDKGGKQ